MNAILSDKAFVLHSRKYTDNKVLLDILTECHGLITVVYRRAKKNQDVQPFFEFYVNFKGRSTLKTAILIERTGREFRLSGEALFCGLYVNELLFRVLAKQDPHPELYVSYCQCMVSLTEGVTNEGLTKEAALRQFELLLLQTLGYGMDFQVDGDGNEIAHDVNTQYRFLPDQGFIKVTDAEVEASRKACGSALFFSGNDLYSIANLQINEDQLRKKAKALCRTAIDSLLGGKVLSSRELFR